MLRTQISLDRDLYDRAKKAARQRGISFAELVRRALTQVLEPGEGEQPWMRFAGTFATGDRDASTTIDEVVYGHERP